MEDASFFSSLFINCTLCLVGIVHFRKSYRTNKLLRWQAYLFYSIFTLVAAFVSGFGLHSWLVELFENAGYIQELGHNASVLISLFQFTVPLIAIPVGLVLINWKKIVY